MYEEPWSNIENYSTNHKSALEAELIKEVSKNHPLYEIKFEILATREDKDDILVSTINGYFIVHLTWSNNEENLPYPSYELFKDIEKLKERLAYDAINF